MCDLSVLVWLDELRFSIENYDQSVLVVEDAPQVLAMDREDGIYEKIWDCTAEFRRFDVKHAKICRISFDFNETVDEIFEECSDDSSSDNSESFVEDTHEDVARWKNDLRFECSSEEDQNEEQELLSQFEGVRRDERSQSGSLLLPFPPVDEDVEIRRHGPKRTPTNRWKTICAPPSDRTAAHHGNAHRDGCFREDEEASVEIRGVSKITFPDGKSRKFAKGCCVRFENRRMYVANEKDGNTEILNDDIKIVAENKVNKKEMEIRDETGKTYRLHFDSTRDVRQYFETGRERSNSFGEKATIRNMLLGLLRKRSSRDMLEKKGIIKNEPIFGNTLINLHEKYKSDVPEFVTKTIELIERPANITSLGLYRASGNLATIQKIRFEVDRNNMRILDDHSSDADVLSGALKLFFRELKEPLIPYQQYEQLLHICANQNKSATNETNAHKQMNRVLDNLHVAHRETLDLLMRHLKKVETHKDENRMDVHNLSVVWGPSLIWLPDQCMATSGNNIRQQQENIIAHSTNAAKVLEFILVTSQAKATENARRDDAGDVDKRNKSNKNDDFQLCDFDDSYVPEVVAVLTKLLETDGVDKMSDLYVSPGDKNVADAICRKVAKVKLAEIEKKHKTNKRELAWVLKNIVGTLRRPFFPQSLSQKSGVAAMAEINNWEVAQRKTAKVLLAHFHKMALMGVLTAEQIATTWSPVLFKTHPENVITRKLLKSLIELQENRNEHIRGEATMLD